MRQHYTGYVQWGFPDFFRRWLSPQPRRVLVFREGGAQASLDVGDDLLRIHLRLAGILVCGHRAIHGGVAVSVIVSIPIVSAITPVGIFISSW